MKTLQAMHAPASAAMARMRPHAGLDMLMPAWSSFSWERLLARACFSFPSPSSCLDRAAIMLAAAAASAVATLNRRAVTAASPNRNTVAAAKTAAPA